jgi:hypothetical protein
MKRKLKYTVPVLVSLMLGAGVGCSTISKLLGLQGQNTVTVNGTNTIVVPPGTAVVPAPSP